MTILIDTREQKPYKFNIPSQVGTLNVGDYSILGLEDCIAIERKEINDLIGSLTTGRERFKKELERAKGLEYFSLVIEASLQDIVNGAYRSNMSPKSAVQSLISFSVRYHLPVWFAESREYGQRLTESLLTKFAKEAEKEQQVV